MIYKYETRKSSELRHGDIVMCHGMLCLIDREIKSRAYDPPQYGCDRVYWTDALVLNRDEISHDSVPFGFTRPRLSNGYTDEEAVARGEHRWGVQGNDNARWSVILLDMPRDPNA